MRKRPVSIHCRKHDDFLAGLEHLDHLFRFLVCLLLNRCRRDPQVIIIPGALVSPFAYSILARSLAQRGYPSFILRLPFDLGMIVSFASTLIVCSPQVVSCSLTPPRRRFFRTSPARCDNEYFSLYPQL